jgi:hypothetical protein
MPSEEDWFVAIMEDYLDLRKVPCFLSLKQRESVSHGPLGAAVHFKEKSKVFCPGQYKRMQPPHSYLYTIYPRKGGMVRVGDKSVYNFAAFHAY